MSLPWYARPIEPSRFAFLLPPIIALLVLAACGAMATLLADASPSGFQGPMCLALAACGWFAAAVLYIRRHRAGGKGLGFKVMSEIACALALTIMGIPSLLWPHLPYDEPVPTATVITQRVCWWAVGVIGAALTYSLCKYVRPSARPRPS